MILGIRKHVLNHFSRYPIHVSSPTLQSLDNYVNSSPISHSRFHSDEKSRNLGLPHTQFKVDARTSSLLYSNIFFRNLSTKPYVRRKKRNKPKTIKDYPHKVAEFERSVALLPARFIAEDLYKILICQDDPLVCLELFSYASQQPRFRHDVSTYHITIKKLGAAQMYEEMDGVVKQVLAVPTIGSEALFNTIIYFYTEARQLAKAIDVYKHMRKSFDEGCRPSVRTYNLLFTSFLSKRNNSYINHLYMETIRCLFKQMVNDGVEPDIFSLNSMIKGYILSLHVNDALRIFHQMGVVYSCHPNSHSYDYLIHGLCCQGRTNNAKELYTEMKSKGFVPSAKAYNSLANGLAIGGEVEEAVSLLWEMNQKRRSADFITFRTVLDEICRQGKVEEALKLLKELQEKDLVDGLTYKKLLHVIEDEFGGLTIK
ncbi:hypothetical protein AQUCO_02700091v1 [Aquilegia coerulea]|uniref:Pentacotripeptide-repeat region of PRORP domain-containing protein n=1 Tax=Aquilegia coerulea TaxID=218851 RepID=A0A2G5D535_AQUCA|nr:hypothetical protein AQUCO_02700091v1 [Aquilegia coerulea]